MPDTISNPEPRPHGCSADESRVVALLADYLAHAEHVCYPGSDGLTMDEVARDYSHEAAAGHVPGVVELTKSHPELALPLRDYLADHQG